MRLPTESNSQCGSPVWPGRIALVVWAAVACCCAGDPVPPLPDPALDGFAVPVQNQLRAARAEVEERSESPSAVGNFGRTLFAYGQFEAAATCFARSRALDPDAFEWTYLHGVTQASLGRQAEARAAFSAAATLRPHDLPTAVRLADVLEQTGDSAGAREVLGRALQASPDSSAVHFRLGRLLRAEDSNASMEHLMAAIRLDPEYREAHYALASAYRVQGRQQEAAEQMALYEQADTVPRRHYADPLVDSMDSIKVASVQAVFNDGYALQRSGDMEGARAAYFDALEIEPEYYQAHVNLVAVYGELGDHELAARHYGRAVALDPSVAEAHYNYGVSRHFALDFEGAAEAFRKALAINPQDPNTIANLATSLEGLGRAPEAERLYRRAVEHHPSHPMANFHLGRLLADRGLYGESLAFLERAVSVESEGTALHEFLLALVYRELGQEESARQSARDALSRARAGGHTDLASKLEDFLAR